MPISFSCECGKNFNVKEELAGKKTKCPVCGKALMIPSAGGDELELDQQDLVPPSERDSPKKKAADVTLSEPASNAGLIFGGAVVAIGALAFLVLLLGFMESNGHDPYMLANSTPIPGNVTSVGPVVPLNPLAPNNDNGSENTGPAIEQKLREYEGVTAFDVSSDGRTIVTNKGKEIVIWDTSTDTALRNLADGHNCTNLLLDVSYQYMLSVGPTPTGGEVRLWNLKAGKLLLKIPLQSANAALGFSDDSTGAFVTNAVDGTILIDVANVKVAPPTTDPWAKANVSAFNIARNTGAFAYVAGANDPRLEIVDLGSLKVTRTISTDAAVRDLTFSNDGRWLIVASAKTLVFNLSADNAIAIPRTPNGQFLGNVAMSSDNRFLAGHTANGLVAWELTSKLDRLITTDKVIDIGFMSDGRLAYTTGVGTIQYAKLGAE